MTITEDQILDRLNSDKPILIESTWLESVYSLDLSIELRSIIGERLGLLADKGWEVTKGLINKHGCQPELIHAAGLCHQRGAYNFLLKFLAQQKKPEINTVRALACWGAILPIEELKRILTDDSMQMRLAGLNLLSFKLHLISETDLCELVDDLLDDFREEVVIQSIKILQRRNEERIIRRISKVSMNGTDKIVETALIALGSIGTEYSALKLSELCEKLTNKNHKKMAQKQLSHQYLNHNS